MRCILVQTHTGPDVLTGLVALSLVILFLVLFLKRLNQPYFIAYILSGLILGPYGLKVLTKPELIAQLGELGIVLLLFFIGLEIRLPDLTHNSRRPVLATLLQLVLSGLTVWWLGSVLDWSVPVVVLITFVLSLSSSAIILAYLKQNRETSTPLGLLTAGVLLVQDMATVPMLLTLNFLGLGRLNTLDLILMVVGGGLILLFLRAAMRRSAFRLPFSDALRQDHDLQVFVGFLSCFGMAWLTSAFHLSAALGAFVGGIIINRSGSTNWLEHSLTPFRVFFLALFFVAVGLQIDVRFFLTNWLVITSLVVAVMLINSLLGTLAFRAAGTSWRDSVYAGALLSQLGEFSIVLGLTARQLGLIDDFIYQLILSVVALSMLVTTLWIEIIRAFLFRTKSQKLLTKL